MSDGFVKSVR